MASESDSKANPPSTGPGEGKEQGDTATAGQGGTPTSGSGGGGGGAARKTYELSGDEDQSDAWFEGENDSDSKAYGTGGYLRVRLGEKLHKRYIIEKKLGWGHFSTVWLATDTKTERLVALKIQKSAHHYMEAALDEIELLTAAKQKGERTNFVAQLLDHFDVHAVNGRHFVFVFELLGHDLLSLIKKYKYQGIPIAIVKQIAKQVLEALDYLHTNCQIIHTDLKPENVIMSQPEPFDIEQVRRERDILIRRTKIRQYNKYQNVLREAKGLSKTQKKRLKQRLSKISEQIDKYTEKTKNWNMSRKKTEADLDGPPQVHPYIKSSIENELPKLRPEDEDRRDHFHFPVVKICDLGNACWVHQHFTEDITTCQYRAPEAILGQNYGPPVDIWSLAAMIFELVTGDYLFNPKVDRENRYSKDEDHLAQIAELCGKFTKKMTQNGRKSHEYFNRKGDLKHIRKLEIWPMVDVLREKYKKTDEEAELFASFLSPMLEPDPSLRSTANECKQHPWLKIAHKDWEELLQSEKEWIGEMEGSIGSKGDRSRNGISREDAKAEGYADYNFPAGEDAAEYAGMAGEVAGQKRTHSL